MGKKLTWARVSDTQLRLSFYTRTNGQEAYLGIGQCHTTQTQLQYQDKWASSLLGHGSVTHNSDSSPILGQMGKQLTLAWISGTQVRLSSYTRTNGQVAYLGMGQWHTTQTQLLFQDKWARSLGMDQWHTTQTQLQYQDKWASSLLGHGSVATSQTRLLYQDKWASSLLEHGSVTHNSDSAPIPGQMGKKLTWARVSGTQLRLSSNTRTNGQVAYLGMGQWHTSQTQLLYKDKWARSLV